MDLLYEFISKFTKKFYDEFCLLHREKVRYQAAICKRTIQRLRNENVYYKNSFVDHKSFQQMSGCFSVQIPIDTKKEPILQPVMICHLRPSITPMNTDDPSMENYDYIAIFPDRKSTMMIFKYIEKDYCMPFDIVLHVSWLKVKEVPEEVFTVKIPTSYINIETIYEMLRNVVYFIEAMR